ncbi:S1/P1 nuclease [Ferribacterium limneticum]|uniref:S1/P1 nuclease n=1 Tax=Ferribacterium limneticum TaxID=76259 RepID=UPI001CFBFC39|nr:S1/P1 nuclease [Ferribacterium limneticum]UCV28567.1 S1/P1 nuclease [Ferribacterium limneticum]UCV32484.1 S1/P1 nuclease [Ferribacterium limneticum]
MRQILSALLFFSLTLPAYAWNAAGHRLVAVIAWQQLTPPTREAISAALARHPDHERWLAKARSSDAIDLFAEASTWPDDIRNDPRFHDEDREAPTPPLPGFPDTGRHKRWHYVDLDAAGKVRDGELERQIERLSRLLQVKASSGGASAAGNGSQISYALPWLLHLVADIHQPLHVGQHGDEGGNKVEIENPFNKRLPFSSLHLYWDDLPGPPWLRGKRLEKNAARLLESYPKPVQGDVALWREESHRLLAVAYPKANGSLLPIISDDFHRDSRDIANRRIVEAGYRLGHRLESIFGQPVSRETQ